MEMEKLIERLTCQGNETLLVSFDKDQGKIYHGGSRGGELFIEQNQIVEKFYSFLTDNYSTWETRGDNSQSGYELNIKSVDTNQRPVSKNVAIVESARDSPIELLDLSHDTESDAGSPLPDVTVDEDTEPASTVDSNKAGTTESGTASMVHPSQVNKKPKRKRRKKWVLSSVKRMRAKASASRRKAVDKDHQVSSSVSRGAASVQNITAATEDECISEVTDGKETEGVFERKGQDQSKADDEQVQPAKKRKTTAALEKNDFSKEISDTSSLDKVNKAQGDELVGAELEEILKKEDFIAEGNVCKICGKQLKTKYSVARHIKDVHAGKVFKCHMCNSQFETKAEIRKHSLNCKRRDGNYLCVKCGQIFQVKENFLQHASKIHGEEKLPLVRMCTICNVKFVNMTAYLKHMSCHESLKVFKCYVCEVSFGLMKELDDHVTTHSMFLTYKCTDCEKICRSSDELNYHLQNFCPKKENDRAGNGESDTHVNDSKTIQDNGDIRNVVTDEQSMEKGESEGKNCKNGEESKTEKDEGIETEVNEEGDECNNSITKRGEAVSERLACNSEESSESVGGKGKETGSSFTVEISQIKDSKDWHVCDLCGQKFKFSIALYKHRLLHDDKGLFPCRFCSLTFNTHERLARHAKTHSRKASYPCEVCTKVYYTKSSLSIHMRSHKDLPNQKCFQCEECGKCFSTNAFLRAHKNLHTGERPYKCQYCANSFISMETLRTHENTHTKKRTYMCDICGMVFYRKCSMYNHKKTHSEVMEHICTKCGKGCRTRGALKTHYVSMHLTQEEIPNYKLRVYQCMTCLKYFADKSDLVIHERVHTGERPYSCSKCGKSFADKSNLRTHEKTHLQVKPFNCQYCGKGYVLNRDLLRHVRNHHEGNPTPPKQPSLPKQQQQPKLTTSAIEEQRQREIRVQIDHLTSREGVLDISRGAELIPHYMTGVPAEGGYDHVTNVQSYTEQAMEYEEPTDAPPSDSNFTNCILIL